jgi:hypothetical protein
MIDEYEILAIFVEQTKSPFIHIKGKEQALTKNFKASTSFRNDKQTVMLI